MLVPIILDSDKTTVTVATGQHDYYPLYLSIGNLHNTARCAHKNGVKLIGFLAMPKSKCWLVVTATNSYVLMLSSYAGARHDSSIPKVSSPTISYLTFKDSRETQASDVDVQSHALRRWALSACHLLSGTLHHRLQGASFTLLHSPQLVCKVSSSCYLLYI